MHSIIISTLAEYQTEFWVPVGEALETSGHAVTFVSCDTRSTRMLEAAGLDVIEATVSARASALGAADPVSVCNAHGITDPASLIAHERIAFAQRSTATCLRKLAGALVIGDAAIERARDKGQPVLVQELGGFASVLGLHHAALHARINSIMIEPSFFKGRMLFVANSLRAPKIAAQGRVDMPAELTAYIENALASGTVVIPDKDRHHYLGPVSKLLKPHNIRRFVEKSRDKHLYGAEQEFGAIGLQLRNHLSMLAGSIRMRGHYTDFRDLGRFLYFPLHVPGDIALTLRSPEYCDQLALLDYLCRVAPVDLTIAIKEHPAMIGAVPSEALIALKKEHDRFAIIRPDANNYDVLRAAECVVTINSKSGAEAGLLGKQPIVLGDAFYRGAPFARAIDHVTQLGPAIAQQVSAPRPALCADETHGFFAALWERSFPGELYAPSKSNIAAFTASVEAALDRQECDNEKVRLSA